MTVSCQIYCTVQILNWSRALITTFTTLQTSHFTMIYFKRRGLSISPLFKKIKIRPRGVSPDNFLVDKTGS